MCPVVPGRPVQPIRGRRLPDPGPMVQSPVPVRAAALARLMRLARASRLLVAELARDGTPVRVDGSEGHSPFFGGACSSIRDRGRQEQCSEFRRLAAEGARGIHSIELGRKSEPCETTMQAVLSPPGRTLVVEIETVSTPGVADEVMNGAKPIKRSTRIHSRRGDEGAPRRQRQRSSRESHWRAPTR